jgi:hypothetical protein
LYLRRKSIEEAVEKLKRGESIGPVTKASLEGRDEEDEEDGSLKKEESKEAKGEKNNELKDETDASSKVVKENGKEAKEEVKEEAEASSKVVPPAQDAPAIAVIDAAGNETEPPSETTSRKPADGEDNSDTHSVVSDIPSTPASTDSTSTTSETPPTDLADENIHEAKELRQVSNKDIIGETMRSQEFQERAANISSLTHFPTIETADGSKVDSDDSSTVTAKPTTTEEGDEIEEIIRPASIPADKTMEGWEMLQMVLQWTRKEFSPDEKALARQLANHEISYRFLWLYYVPGSLISLQDPVSKQQMAARVPPSCYIIDDRLKVQNICPRV